MSKAELLAAWMREYEGPDQGFFSVHSIGLEIHEEPRVGTSAASEVGIWRKSPSSRRSRVPGARAC